MYNKLDIYNEMFLKYENFINENIEYEVNIQKKTPQTLSKFPTILFKETNNINGTFTTNRQEFIDEISYTIEIYTKDTVVTKLDEYSNPTKQMVASNVIMRELINYTYDFFLNMKFNRELVDDGDYTDITVDRKIMIFSCTLNSWNRKIN